MVEQDGQVARGDALQVLRRAFLEIGFAYRDQAKALGGRGLLRKHQPRRPERRVDRPGNRGDGRVLAQPSRPPRTRQGNGCTGVNAHGDQVGELGVSQRGVAWRQAGQGNPQQEGVSAPDVPAHPPVEQWRHAWAPERRQQAEALADERRITKADARFASGKARARAVSWRCPPPPSTYRRMPLDAIAT